MKYFRVDFDDTHSTVSVPTEDRYVCNPLRRSMVLPAHSKRQAEEIVKLLYAGAEKINVISSVTLPTGSAI